MNFDMKEAVAILERTPLTLTCLLSGLSDRWLQRNEGEGTWNAFEVVEHLIEGEKHNWIPRIEWILQEGESKPFPPFDRESHLRDKSVRAIGQALAEFQEIRELNIKTLKTRIDPEAHLELTGLHPEFGAVRMRELISTWAVHDLTHMTQIIRVMAVSYKEDVGPWKAYLGVLKA